MSRWPRGIDAAYRKYESEQRMERILAIRVSYGCCKERALAEPIIDRDPGDESDTKEQL